MTAATKQQTKNKKKLFAVIFNYYKFLYKLRFQKSFIKKILVTPSTCSLIMPGETTKPYKQKSSDL